MVQDAEAGVVPWYAFFTRSGAPAEVTAKINADIAKVLALPGGYPAALRGWRLLCDALCGRACDCL